MRPGLQACLLLVALSAPACGGDPTDEAVKRVIDDLSAQQFGRATARYRGQEEVIISPEAAPTWRRGLEHQDATVREWSVDALARIGLPEDVPRVIAALDDPFRRVQESAALGLQAMAPDEATRAFLERVATGDSMQRTIAAQGLADLGSAGAVPALIEQLGDRSIDNAVRGVMAQSLAKLGDAAAAEALSDIAANADEDVQLRRTAAEALATLPGAGAGEALERLAESDDAYIRGVVARALDVRRD